MGNSLETLKFVCLFLMFLPLSKAAAANTNYFTQTNSTGLVLHSYLTTESSQEHSRIYSKKIRMRRDTGTNVATSVGADIVGGVVGMWLDSAFPVRSEIRGQNPTSCARKWGCYQGYCWAGCDATAVNNEWCYTTRGYSQDYQYIRCSRDSECSDCWACAGACTV